MVVSSEIWFQFLFLTCQTCHVNHTPLSSAQKRQKRFGNPDNAYDVDVHYLLELRDGAPFYFLERCYASVVHQSPQNCTD